MMYARFLLLLAVCAAPGWGAQADDQLQAHIAKLEIAGVYWGQKEADAIQELTGRGYHLDNSDKANAKSFAQQVEYWVSMRQQHGWDVGREDHTYGLSATKGQETILVTLIGYPDGWRVDRVSYEYKGGPTPKELGKKAAEKYIGAGLTKWQWTYCVPRVRFCSSTPNIIVRDWGGDFSMELTPGDLGEKTAYAPFAEAIAKAKGLEAPSF